MTEAGSALAYALRVLQVADAPQETLREVLERAIALLDRLPADAQAEWRRAMMFFIQLILHKRDVEEHEQLREMVIDAAERRHDQEVSEMAKTAAEVYEERGRREGRIERRSEGRIEGRRAMLLHLMRRKFGVLPDGMIAKVEALDTVAELDQLSDRVLIANSLDDMGLEED